MSNAPAEPRLVDIAIELSRNDPQISLFEEQRRAEIIRELRGPLAERVRAELERKGVTPTAMSLHYLLALRGDDRTFDLKGVIRRERQLLSSTVTRDIVSAAAAIVTCSHGKLDHEDREDVLDALHVRIADAPTIKDLSSLVEAEMLLLPMAEIDADRVWARCAAILRNDTSGDQTMRIAATLIGSLRRPGNEAVRRIVALPFLSAEMEHAVLAKLAEGESTPVANWWDAIALLRAAEH